MIRLRFVLLIVACGFVPGAAGAQARPPRTQSRDTLPEPFVHQAPAGNGFAAVSAGWVHGLALRVDGSLTSW